jgi:hypothetical protein
MKIFCCSLQSLTSLHLTRFGESFQLNLLNNLSKLESLTLEKFQFSYNEFRPLNLLNFHRLCIIPEFVNPHSSRCFMISLEWITIFQNWLLIPSLTHLQLQLPTHAFDQIKQSKRLKSLLLYQRKHHPNVQIDISTVNNENDIYGETIEQQQQRDAQLNEYWKCCPCRGLAHLH